MKKSQISKHSSANNTTSEKNLLGKIKFGIVLFIGVLLTISLIRNITSIIAANNRLSDKKTELLEAEEKNKTLKKELDRIGTLEYKEKQARDSLGMAKEGEVAVVLPSEEELKKLSPIRRENTMETKPDPNWKKWVEPLFSSL